MDNRRKHVKSKMALYQECWDPEYWYKTIAQSQCQRLKIHRVTGGDPNYVHKIRDDDDRRYIRNDSAAETKARARLPSVAPAKPD